MQQVKTHSQTETHSQVLISLPKLYKGQDAPSVIYYSTCYYCSQSETISFLNKNNFKFQNPQEQKWHLEQTFLTRHQAPAQDLSSTVSCILVWLLSYAVTYSTHL